MKKSKEDAIKLPLLLERGGERLLLHACCAPCSSAIVEWLLQHDVQPTIFYYNPNIWPREEYEIRKEESKRHAASLGIEWIDGDYSHDAWLQGVCGLEGEPERGRRCEQCFTMRLLAAARMAQQLGIAYFATTLASSRWKSLDQINRAGLAAEQTVNCHLSSVIVHFWPQNWRKGGLQERRNQLLREYNFYNQQYCGCEFSAAHALTKPLLRQQMRLAKQHHQSQLASMSAAVADRLRARLTSLSPRLSALTVMTYWPLPDEVDVRPLSDWLLQQGATVLLPKVVDDEHMELRRYTSRDDLTEGAFHIMEPVGAPFTDYGQISVVLVPGVAFDAAGHRLGRGRGYYDRFLARLGTGTLFLGVCFPFQRVAAVPADAHDVAVHEVV
jgi:5,10-methenyltetrahydrofolate synthetase